MNTFATKDSDIDLILTFEDEKLVRHLDKKAVLQTIATGIDIAVAAGTGTFEVKEIVLNARVPVLKLVHIESNIDIDVCYNNLTALLNTRLLMLYSDYDPRVRPLIMMIKRWSSNRGISDSTNSTITSYAWNLLVIYFLQQSGVLPYPIVAKNSISIGNEFSTSNTVLPSTADAATLLIHFFLYYGSQSQHSFNMYSDVAAVKSSGELLKQCYRPIVAALSASNMSALGFTDDEVQIMQRSKAHTSSVGASQVEVVDTALIAKSENASERVCDVDVTARLFEKLMKDEKPRISQVANNAHISWKMCIEDPFEDHDLGKVVHKLLGFLTISNELQRAMIIIHNFFVVYAPTATIVRRARPPDDESESFLLELLSVNGCVPKIQFTCNLCGSTDHLKSSCRFYTDNKSNPRSGQRGNDGGRGNNSDRGRRRNRNRNR